MTTQFIEKITSIKEQRFVLPGCHSWQEFKAIQALIAEIPGVRISYVDGFVELMTISEQHENIKSILAILLEGYFFEIEINFIPVGSATRENETKGASFDQTSLTILEKRKSIPILLLK